MDKNALHRALIERYLTAYNTFDIEGMMDCLAEGCRFENVSQGAVNAACEGKAKFREMAEMAKSFFVSRRQTVRGWTLGEQGAAIEVDYTAVLAVDFPGGTLKKGDTMQLRGVSCFEIAGDRITRLSDYS